MDRTCKKCGQTKKLVDFAKDASKKLGYQHICRICKRESCKSWRNRNKEAYNEKRRNDPKVKEDNRIKRRKTVQNKLKIDPEWIRKFNLMKNFGLTVEEYDKMVEDSGGCEICGLTQEESLKIDNRRLCVDHCHITGKIRGILCSKCNTALGKFKDSPQILQIAINYLNKEVM